MIRTCLFLLAGVYALQLTSFAALFGVFIFTLPVFLIFRSRLPAQGVVFFLAGIILFAFAAIQVVSSRLATQFAGDSMLLQVRIADFPKTLASTVTFVAEPVDDVRIPPRIRVSWFEPPVKLRLGDVWQIELRLRRPRGNSNPGVFDYEAWMFRERIAAVGYVVSSKRNHLLRSGDLSGGDRLRQGFVDRLTELLPDRDAAAVLAAIGVGARHLVSPEQWERYARTGTSHLMAISGLHIGLAAGVAYFFTLILSGMTGCRGNHSDVALIVSLIAAVAYAFVSGFEIPARRAALMITFIVFASLGRRQVSPLLILCAACVVIAVLDPLATMAPGFKLSFAAVLILIWLARRRIVLRSEHRLYWMARTLRSLASLQVLLLLGLLPLTVLIFQRAAVAAPLVNLIAVPLFSVVTVPLTLVALVSTGVLQPLGDMALSVASGSVGLLEWGIVRAASASAASIPVAAVTGLAWLILPLPVLLILLPPGWPGRHLAWIAVVALVMHEPAVPAPGCADIEVLDVGQGLAVIVRTRRHIVVFDTGLAFRNGGSMGQRVVLPYLSSLGTSRIDRLIVSHADLDHSGGVDDIIAGIAVDEMLVGEPLPNAAMISRPCTAGTNWRWDGIDFQIIHPADTQPVDGNDASCVLIVAAGGYRLVLTGDIEKSVEYRLIRNGAVPRATVVVVPHHGSRTSSTSPFVRALSPSIAIVSAGFDNRWGFPKAEVVARWESAGAKVLETATSGAIALRMCARSGIDALTEHRQVRYRIWHER